jgi:DNA topoisomerase VI subunit A
LHRFGAVLFIEKEGFLPLLERVKLAERFDLAIMSTKGMSNIASRKLIDSVCGEFQIPLLVLHDFDTAGFTILGTLSNSTARYEYQNQIRVIDLGLRLEDVYACNLESEACSSKRNMETTLHQYGATDEEIGFLNSERVELNAFPSADFVAWIESKLKKHGIKKILPEVTVMTEAYRRAVESMYLEEVIEDAEEDAACRAAKVPIPKGLDKRIRAMLKNDPSLAWDAAISKIAVTCPRLLYHLLC